MYFRSTALWLFWLTFVSVQHNQFNTDGCFGAALQQQQQQEQQQPLLLAARAYGTQQSAAINSKATATESKGTEENSEIVPKDVADDMPAAAVAAAAAETTASGVATLNDAPFASGGHNVAATATRTDNFAFDFKRNLAKLFTNGEDAAAAGDSVAAADISAGSSMPSHMPGRRHIVHEKLQYTKEISIKQGRLMGICRNFHPSTGLRDVDQYLGMPYAEAPVGSRRFMPPGAPLPWQGLKIARHLPPVCPQKLPDVSAQSSAKMSRGRYKHLTRLLPYLKNEREDCLYLNVYVPRGDGFEQAHAYPVIVYVHGESFEWNSGNPYDGSVLASYGQTIVVTVNYRLGVMGFLRTTIAENSVANFGLLDQIAALHWIKENIASFGGDKDRVTLMGHSTGAACVNYLMVSPVASGLFHRAILMSGSAMSDWAASNQSLQVTMQLAHGLDCPLQDQDEEMLNCLRTKRYQDLTKMPMPFPQFTTPVGPIVDGHVVPHEPYKDMGQYTELFSRYDLLFGITESESYHTLGALALDDGLRENERDNLLRFYMQSRFDVRPDLALAATLKKYQDVYNNPIKATSSEHRDAVLDILSDARVVGPLMQTGLFHAEVNRRNYMYVFGHNSAAGPHASLPHSITGEELAFIFGAPLAPAGPFHNNYGAQEKLLSEAVMAYWTNFAKTGNPKAPWRGSFLNLHAMEWDRYDLDWPEFNKRSQAYFNIGIPPSIGYKYRNIYMNFWNKELPDELNQIAAIQLQPFVHAQQNPSASMGQLPRGGTSPMQPSRFGHLSNFATRDNVEDPVRTLKLLLQEPHGGGGQAMQVETAENMYNAPPTFAVSRNDNDEVLALNTMPTNMVNGGSYISSTAIYGVNRAGTESDANAKDSGIMNESSDGDKSVAKSEATLQLLIGLIIIFIVLNVIIYSTILLQKKKKATTMSRKLGGILSYDGATDDELKRSKHTTQNDGDESYILDMVRKSNTYEAVKTERSPINGFKITRQLSTSTVDTHTKVCEWMSAAKGAACGGGTLSRMQTNNTTNKCSSSPTFSSMRGSSGTGTGGSFTQRPHQVNVSVDATPQARSNSVLCQEPIEVTRYKTDGRANIIICQEVEVSDQELLTPQNSLDASRYSLMRQHSAATEACDAELSQCQHKHSRSDPVEMYYSDICDGNAVGDEQITSFMGDAAAVVVDVAPQQDINVTSRDDYNSDEDGGFAAMHALTPAQQLTVIKRRNYPKVLPTTSMNARVTDSPPMTADLSMTYKRNSLPPNSFLPHFFAGVGGCGKQPPLPPPRTISTLGRKPSLGRQAGRRNSNNITTSPLMLAQDTMDEEDEPEITHNTLIVGPIVPNSRVGCGEGNYSTLKRKALEQEGFAADKDTPLNANEATNCDVAAPNGRTDGQTNESAKVKPQLRRAANLPTLCLTPLTAALSGSFQSFESRPNLADETVCTTGAHHTEKVYAIKPASAGSATPRTPCTPTTPLSPNYNYYSAPTTPSAVPATLPSYTPAIGVIYAQSTKCAIKPNSIVGPSKSGIPRIMPAMPTTTTTAAALSPTIDATASAQVMATDCSQLVPMTASNQMLATATAATMPTTPTTSRIPQLNRNMNAVPQPQPQPQPQHTNKDKPNGNSATTAMSTITATTPITTAAAATTTATTKLTTAAAIAITATSVAPLVSKVSTESTSSTDSSFSSSSESSTSSCASTVSSATSSSASSSSTGTVRTELLQQK